MNLVELVPHDPTELLGNAKDVLANYPAVSGINVPDILSVMYRSHDACSWLLEHNITAIPHIRCIDRPMDETLGLVRNLVQKGLKHVLIVSGDKPNSLSHPTFPITPTHIVSELKKEYGKDLFVYCGLDPYRYSFRQELEYCESKLLAGTDGFFTQPFFDKDLVRIYLEQLAGSTLFIGISPVLTERSLNYWITKNNAIFPRSFALDLQTNCEIAKEIITMAEQFNQNTYTMPIKAPLWEYLDGIFK